MFLLQICMFFYLFEETSASFMPFSSTSKIDPVITRTKLYFIAQFRIIFSSLFHIPVSKYHRNSSQSFTSQIAHSFLQISNREFLATFQQKMQSSFVVRAKRPIIKFEAESGNTYEYNQFENFRQKNQHKVFQYRGLSKARILQCNTQQYVIILKYLV